MNIPDKAFQAALDTMWDAHDWDEWDEPVDIAGAALKAAAPFIAAQALRDLHGRIGELEDQDIEAVAEYIWFRSNLLDPQ